MMEFISEVYSFIGPNFIPFAVVVLSSLVILVLYTLHKRGVNKGRADAARKEHEKIDELKADIIFNKVEAYCQTKREPSSPSLVTVQELEINVPINYIPVNGTLPEYCASYHQIGDKYKIVLYALNREPCRYVLLRSKGD